MNINPLKSSKNNVHDMDIDISMNKNKSRKGTVRISPAIIIMSIILILAIAAAGFFFYQYSQAKQKVDNPTQALDEQSKAIKISVSKLYDLGNVDDYSVASITNVENLKKDNPDFYKNAANGDYLVVSQVKAILYNKERNIILGVAPIINNPTETATPAPVSTTAPTSIPTVQPTQKK